MVDLGQKGWKAIFTFFILYTAEKQPKKISTILLVVYLIIFFKKIIRIIFVTP